MRWVYPRPARVVVVIIAQFVSCRPVIAPLFFVTVNPLKSQPGQPGPKLGVLNFGENGPNPSVSRLMVGRRQE